MEDVLNATYWDERYQKQLTAWDIGEVSFPLKSYFDQIQDKELAILIPGCGNAYEAAYLVDKGFQHITIIDFAPKLIESLRLKFAHHAEIKIIQEDFFAHQGKYDLIIEQTFFCAFAPHLRSRYVTKMKELLAPNGKLMGVLFQKEFTKQPPFGGNKEDYLALFAKEFKHIKMELCINSHRARQGAELWIKVND